VEAAQGWSFDIALHELDAGRVDRDLDRTVDLLDLCPFEPRPEKLFE
jgi:hypothetical protein